MVVVDRCALNARIICFVRVVLDRQRDGALQDEIGVDIDNCTINVRAWWISSSSSSYWWDRILYLFIVSCNLRIIRWRYNFVIVNIITH